MSAAESAPTPHLSASALKRLMQAPTKGKQRFVYNRSFLDALDYARIVARAEKRSEKALNAWADLYDLFGTIF